MIPRKINLIGPWPPPYGGVAIHLSNLVESIKDRFNIQLFDYSQYKYNKYKLNKNLSFTHIYLKPFLWPYAFLKLNKYIQSFDIIHNHSIINSYPNSFIINKLLTLIHRKKNILIDSVHDQTLMTRFPYLPPKDKDSLLKYWQEVKIIITINNALKDFVSSLNVDNNKIFIINPLLPFKKEELGNFLVVDEFIKQHDIIFSTIGAFHPFYDLDTIIEAFILFQKEYRDAGLILIQCGFASSLECMKQIKMTIKKAKKEKSVLILKDIPHKQVLYILKRSNIFIRGVKEESFGLSKIEALLMGTPVICTETGEVKFMTTYQFKNKEDLVNKIQLVLQNREKNSVIEAQKFFNNIAADNLSNIIKIYEDFSKI